MSSSSESPGMHEASRREKLRKIRELGHRSLGQRFDDHMPIGEIRAREGEITVEPSGAEQREPTQHGPKVRAAGRIVLQRKKGKLIFVDIRDWTGQIQLFIGRNQVGEDNWALAECFDLGDLIGVDGELKRTKTGELTIFAEKLHFLTKSIEPPPEKHHGLTDPELRQRMRYLDLIYTDGVLDAVLEAHEDRAVDSPARWPAQGFVEVEGPDAALDRRRRRGPAVQDASQRARHAAVPADRAGAASQAAAGRRHRAGVTNWAASIATRGSARGTIPSSRCSRSTRPTATTAR